MIRRSLINLTNHNIDRIISPNQPHYSSPRRPTKSPPCNEFSNLKLHHSGIAAKCSTEGEHVAPAQILFIFVVRSTVLVLCQSVVAVTTTWPAEVNNGVTTSWIPFVTPGFSISPSCSAQMYIVPGSSLIVAFDPWQQINIEWQLQCLPAEVIEYWAQSQSANPTDIKTWTYALSFYVHDRINECF
jgi:hypothetical protein